MWDNSELVPHQTDDQGFLRLNFKLHIYFAVQKISHELEPVADCLHQVRTFFDREGSRLSEEAEFVHYYALPFVSSPATHPTFRPIFQEGWSRRLRCDVCTYVKSLRELCGEALLVKIVLVHCGEESGGGRGAGAGSQYRQLLSSHRTLRQEYQKLTR